MGHNIEGRSISTGDFVIGIEQRCSSSLWDMFHKYHVSPKIWHGHSSGVLLHNINQAINAVIKDNARYVKPGKNPNFYLGHHEAGQERLDMFFAWLRYWRNIVEEHPNLRWYSDQVKEIIPYEKENIYYHIESDGEDIRANEEKDGR